MTRIQFTILFLVCITIVLGGVLLGSAALAQDVPPCVDVEQFIAEAKDGKAEEKAYLEYETRHADKFRFVEYRGMLWVLKTNKGCLMGEPVALDYVKDRGEPA